MKVKEAIAQAVYEIHVVLHPNDKATGSDCDSMDGDPRGEQIIPQGKEREIIDIIKKDIRAGNITMTRIGRE